jgi:hypothetical protein
MSNEYRFRWEMPAKAGSPSFNVMVAIPSSYRPYAGNHLSTAATLVQLARLGIAGELYIHRGNCSVDDARNEMMRDFLETDCTDLFFVDDDVDWRPENFVRLLKVPGDIVAGIYPHRDRADDHELTFPFHPGEGVREANDDGLFSMSKVPTGFMRLRRNVVEALYARELAKQRIFWRKPADRHAGRKGVARIVERGFAGELGLAEQGKDEWGYLSGDYVLCLKAKQLGFSIWADVDMEMGHAGEVVTTGHLGNHLRKQQRVWAPAFHQAVEDLRQGKTDAATFQALAKGYDIGRHSFSLRWDLLQALYQEAREAKGPVLELGSGLSTLVLAIALEGTSHAAQALECDLDSWRDTARLLQQFKARSIDLHYAPLIPVGEGRNEVAYSPVEMPASFALALVDGPYHSIQRVSAVHALSEHLEGATLLIDDHDTCAPLLVMLKQAFDLDVRPGVRKWVRATPKPRVAAEPIKHTLPGKLVVSLTSHPPRFGMLKQALESILNQDMRPDVTVLWLAPHEFAALPYDLLRMNGLTIRQCGDIGPYKKLVPALEAYPDAYIVTADDDLVYPRTWLRGLVEAHRSNKEILLRRARLGGMDATGAPTPYNSWRLATAQDDTRRLFPTSCHGMLVPPGAMSAEVQDRDFLRLSPKNDDIWWHWMGRRGGSTFRVIGGDLIRDLPTGADGLWSQHNRDGGNDRQIAALCEAYGLPWAPVREAAE